jgi:glutamyl-tRNA(Gln) amidotransferase subunit D
MPESNGGYRGASHELLSAKGISVGDSIIIRTSDSEVAGLLMPRYESAGADHIVIKLKSGYNAGYEVSKIREIIKVPAQEGHQYQNPSTSIVASQVKDTLPQLALISTGGTIASKVDYRTGGVRAALTASELYSSVPELARYASIEPEMLLNEYSENLGPEQWTLIADKIAEKVRSGKYSGVLVSHGTDTMHYTASALSFALQNLPIPVVLVGAQRSSDRPSSDAALNLLGATIFAASSGLTGVFVSMHAGTSDDVIACHTGTRVRKNHTSRRDAFESIDASPVALIRGDSIEVQNPHPTGQIAVKNKAAYSVTGENFTARTRFDKRVALMKFYPGFDPSIISWAVSAGYRGIILEGTGLGHVSRACFPSLQAAINSGVLVCMTSQCIWGRVRMTVYDTGRDLLDMGVIPLSDMIPETAVVKAMWALANTKDLKEAKDIMQSNIAGEISRSIPI